MHALCARAGGLSGRGPSASITWRTTRRVLALLLLLLGSGVVLGIPSWLLGGVALALPLPPSAPRSAERAWSVRDSAGSRAPTSSSAASWCAGGGPDPVGEHSPVASRHPPRGPCQHTSPEFLLPKYVGSVLPETVTVEKEASSSLQVSNDSLTWNGTCLLWNEASARIDQAAKGATLILSVKSSQPLSLLCSDVLALATPFRVALTTLNFMKRASSVKMGPLTEEELMFVRERGAAVFLLPRGLAGAVMAALELAPLLSNSDLGERLQRQFLESHMGASFRLRSKPWVADLGSGPWLSRALPFLSSGDLILSSKFRGPWGLFESLEKWVSGSWMGHVAVLLRGSCSAPGRLAESVLGRSAPPGSRRSMVSGGPEGDCLWVAESGRLGDKGQPLIEVVSFEEWWQKVRADPAGPHVAVLPLSGAVRRRWNNTEAWRLVQSLQGLSFGFHNFLFSWIDTAKDNFPSPLDEHTVAAVLSMWRHLMPDLISRVVDEALNKRLGTEGLDLEGVLLECAKRNITFGQLLAVPEQDNWVYSDGVSASCVALAVRMWRAAGVFGSLSEINAGEFTIRDAYQLSIYEEDPAALPSWCTRGRNVTFCQLAGKYEVDLPAYNTIQPYPHMNEHCSSMPPDYARAWHC